MAKELKDIGDEYRKASQDSFASVVRSVGEIQRGFQGIASEMTEQSKRSVGQALELQARIAKKAYDAYLSEVTKLGQMMFSGYQSFLTRAEEQQVGLASTSGTQRTAAHRLTSSRKTGAATRQSNRKRRITRKSKRSR
jgi:beta-phosphoglucomutase-like phosphatase (HAD superfamily)